MILTNYYNIYILAPPPYCRCLKKKISPAVSSNVCKKYPHDYQSHTDVVAYPVKTVNEAYLFVNFIYKMP